MRTADDEDATRGPLRAGRRRQRRAAGHRQLAADPPPRTGFIDRCLVAAYDAEIEPLLCLTKADLRRARRVLDYYAELDLPHVLCRPDEPPRRRWSPR